MISWLGTYRVIFRDDFPISISVYNNHSCEWYQSLSSTLSEGFQTVYMFHMLTNSFILWLVHWNICWDWARRHQLSSALPPPPMTGETVQYSRPSEKQQPCRQTPQEPVQDEVISNEERSHGQEDQEKNNAEPTDLHPLGQQQTVSVWLYTQCYYIIQVLAVPNAHNYPRQTNNIMHRKLFY